MNAQITWTPERIAKLEEMYRSETPVQQIANLLGVSKNSVCGKASRLGLTKPDRSPLLKKAKTAPTKKKKKVLKKAPESSEVKPRNVKKIGHFKLRKGEPEPLGDTGKGCQWLHGDARDRNFCGHTKRGSSSWCEHHHKCAYSQAPKNKIRVPVQ